MDIRGTTQVYAIIGWPVRHSLSPFMQNQAFAACSLDAVYVPLAVKPEELKQAVSGMKVLGVAGFNVTIPHKSAIIPFLEELDETARVAGAVNTVLNENGRLKGFNTDGDGLVRSLSADLGFEVSRQSVVVAGAGGAARGAVAALCRAGARRIVIANRSRQSACDLVTLMSDKYIDTEVVALDGYEQLPDCLVTSDLFVNTTSLGMNNEKIPFFKPEMLPNTAAVYDMVYAPPVTPLLADADAAGLRCCNGLGMLAAQGELAFTVWTGIKPPLGLMKSALEAIWRP